ncbi:hypothetical protein APHAL10511_005495 [Amanita phalloides]|nr:hypothetical protein APHAL10511_005495 [Amanita phalloides]
MSSSITSFLSSLFQTIHADAPEVENKVEEAQEEVENKSEEAQEEVENKAEEAEEEEPEDVHPIIREECKQSGKCVALTKHFEHCQEKVRAGKGYHGEDCVEELCMC